ncbi:MAG: DUF1679 domain-containing protein [Bacteroidales bacterium]|nr:DUF1679 domain-containing protein [Bacteroidales bacterium]
MNEYLSQIIKKQTGATDCSYKEKIQDLWSGYGEIYRVELHNAPLRYIIVKHIRLKDSNIGKISKADTISHQRKLRSYEVEINWYKNYSKLCNDNCIVADCIYFYKENNEIILLLSDLHEADYNKRIGCFDMNQIKACLKWLAAFHGLFMDTNPKDLWKTGTYWHLQTRKEEFQKIKDEKLKQIAPKLDLLLNSCKYKTIVHGDAKTSNFLYNPYKKTVAAFDFQYVGGGCGMKDIVYLFDCTMSPQECKANETVLLKYYFEMLKDSLQKEETKAHFTEIETEWRNLYHIAWLDYYRFLKGWTSEQYAYNSYCETVLKNCTV